MHLIHFSLTLIQRLKNPFTMATKARDYLAPVNEAPFTTICFTLSNGNGRVFTYPRVLGSKEAQNLLDPLLDEMRGEPFAGPVEIHRHWKNGAFTSEVVGLLPVED